MKLLEYIEMLQDIAEEHGNIDVIYSSDDEGNEFSFVQYEPDVCEFDGECDAIFDGEFDVNAVCIN